MELQAHVLIVENFRNKCEIFFPTILAVKVETPYGEWLVMENI